jgi:hypothetical protein
MSGMFLGGGVRRRRIGLWVKRCLGLLGCLWRRRSGLVQGCWGK